MRSQLKITGLSGNEIFCLRLRGLIPSGILVGNSVQSMGFLGSVGSAFRGVIGGEIPAITEMIHAGRERALDRMVAESKQLGVRGIVGVSSDLRQLAGNAEFLFTGSGVRAEFGGHDFTSSGDAQELFCHWDAGYQPLAFVFGNIAYSVGAVGGIFGTMKTLVRGEIKEFSDVFNKTRHDALARIVAQARQTPNANAVVGIRTMVTNFVGAHEMYMMGTASSNPALHAGEPVTSDLTGEELWSLTQLGYAPMKLLISTSVYSLGVVGGLKAALKGFVKGEISDLTTLIYDARENVFDRIESEAEQLGTDEVVGIKMYIVELGSSLIEMVGVGTAVKKVSGVKTETPNLPVQAIIRDKDTWLSGVGGFDLQQRMSE
jgi:uncharacterized protein YbjQ (UPF0145 family)